MTFYHAYGFKKILSSPWHRDVQSTQRQWFCGSNLLESQFLKRITHHSSVPSVISGVLYKLIQMVCNLSVLAFFLRTMPLRSIKVAKCVIVCFLFIAKWYSIAWRSHNLFIHSTIEWHLGCFQVLTITNASSLNICVYVFEWKSAFISLWYIPSSVTVISYRKFTLVLL